MWRPARGESESFIRTRKGSFPPIWQPWRRCSTRRGNLAFPTLIHASEPVGHAYPGKGTVTPDMLEALIRAYPDNTFVFAHFGGGMPFYALMPEVAASLANVYFDSAAFTHLYRPEVFQTAVTACGVERILFASDYPLVSQTRALRRMRKGGLSKSDEAAVLGGNAARLLKLNRNAED